MKPMKFSGLNDKDWRCVLCCHVRTGTILLGVWYLIVHVIVMSMVAVVLIHPELLEDQRLASDDILSVEPVENEKSYEFHYSVLKNYDVDVSLMVTFCTFIITVIMVYGAIKGKPKLLLPFFCLQCFDFCITCLTAIGYFTYMPDIRQTIMHNPNIPFQKELLSIDPQWLSLMAFIAFIIVMVIKAYFIGVVWSYYKFLILRNTAYNVPEVVSVETQVLLPIPDYETATKDVKEIPPCSTPPPPYTPRVDSI